MTRTSTNMRYTQAMSALSPRQQAELESKAQHDGCQLCGKLPQYPSKQGHYISYDPKEPAILGFLCHWCYYGVRYMVYSDSKTLAKAKAFAEGSCKILPE